MTTERIRVTIPGSFAAHYDMESGTVTGLVFTPHGGDAGYFGPSAVVDYNLDDWREPLSDDAIALDVEDTDGPFWRAVQDALANDYPKITWEE